MKRKRSIVLPFRRVTSRDVPNQHGDSGRTTSSRRRSRGPRTGIVISRRMGRGEDYRSVMSRRSLRKGELTGGTLTGGPVRESTETSPKVPGRGRVPVKDHP